MARRSPLYTIMGEFPLDLKDGFRSNVRGRHAGSGFQSSWGSAAVAVELLEKAIAGTPA